MDYTTKKFLDDLLRQAAENTRNMSKTPEDIERTKREVDDIRIKSSIALEKLESGQRAAYHKHYYRRYL